MENLSKALLIAAGMLFTIMILSMLMITYNQIASHYQQKHELAVIEQTELFNNEFENYNRSYIRGNELISLMNKIIDYNISQSYRADVGSKRILVTIQLPSSTKVIENGFKIGDTDLIIDETITNTKAGNRYDNDKELIKITGVGPELIGELNTEFGITITEEKLQKLSADISNILLDENDEKEPGEYSKRFKRATLLRYILGLNVVTSYSGASNEIVIDNETGITSPISEDKMNSIKGIAAKYYQYTQFKRACFECTDVKYDVETKRIVEMNFEMQVDANNNIIFD